MKILIVAEHNLLPAVNYGGAPRMAWSLGKELSAMGHEVSFLARKGSVCDFAKIIVRNPEVKLTDQIPENVDVVHFNSPVPADIRKPYVETIHGNFNANLSPNSVFVSRDHARRFNSNSFVYNGLDWDEYGTVSFDVPRTYYHFLGKASWRVKNVRGSIAVAKSLKNEQLHVLGGHRLNFKMGFRFTLSPRIKFHGMVGGEVKNRLLNGSKGLIFPVVWHEPFGLAVIESLYFGAPVFATPYGALPEIVTDEVGFLTNSKSLMIRAIEESRYDPRRCHEYARDTFNARKMAEGYLEKYELVLNGKTLNDGNLGLAANQVATVWKE